MAPDDSHEQNATTENGRYVNGRYVNGVNPNGRYVNGRYVQGRYVNGRYVQGRYVNGAFLNGRYVNGRYVNGLSLGGRELSSSLEGPSIVAQDRKSGERIRGAALEGASIPVTLDNGSVMRVVIDEVAEHRAKYELYYLSLQTDEGAVPACGVDSSDRPIAAVPLAGSWNYDAGYQGAGGKVLDSDDDITFACLSVGALGKCVQLGYTPWTSEHMDRLHQACVRMIRADYCGDGTSWTLDGNLVNIADNDGVQQFDGTVTSDKRKLRAEPEDWQTVASAVSANCDATSTSDGEDKDNGGETAREDVPICPSADPTSQEQSDDLTASRTFTDKAPPADWYWQLEASWDEAGATHLNEMRAQTFNPFVMDTLANYIETHSYCQPTLVGSFELHDLKRTAYDGIPEAEVLAGWGLLHSAKLSPETAPAADDPWLPLVW